MPTTYNFNNRNLANQPANSTNPGRYPIDVGSGIIPYYQPDCTAYIQKGDTVNYTLSNPASGQTTMTYVRGSNGVAAQSYPDPTNGGSGAGSYSGSGGQVHTEPTTFTYTWPTNLVDNQSSNLAVNDTMWPWFGGPVVAAGQTYAGSFSMSRKCRIRVVTGTLSLSASQVNQGGTVRITGVNLSGLFPVNQAISVHANKLYVTVWNPNGTVFTTLGSNGLTWGPSGHSSQHKGWLHQTTTTGQARDYLDLTVGANMPAGVYTIYLNHYNASDSYNSEREYGTTTRMHSVQLTVGTPAQTTPNAFGTVANGFTSYTQRATGTDIPSSIVTLSGTNQAVQISVTGNGSPQYRTRAVGGTFGAYTNSTSTIPAGYQFQFQITCSTASSATVTGTLNIGGVTGTISATTAATGSTGQGGTGANPGTHGLQVKNAAGNITFSPSHRTMNFVNASQTPLSLNAGQTSANLPAEGLTQNNSTDLAILINVPSAATYAPAVTVSRYNNYFTITNTTSATVSGINWMVIRY